jgi:hypothetical protein
LNKRKEESKSYFSFLLVTLFFSFSKRKEKGGKNKESTWCLSAFVVNLIKGQRFAPTCTSLLKTCSYQVEQRVSSV